MNRNESEKVIRETIEYANKEVEKSKKKYMTIMIAVILIVFIAIASYLAIFKYEMPVKYTDDLVEASIPEDEGIDVRINISNYKEAKAILVHTGDNTYDLYINVTQTLATKLFKDNDVSNNLLRVGNGIIVDYQTEKIRGNLPGDNDEKSIQHIYYIDKLSNEVESMSDSELIEYSDKILIWEREQ